MEAISIKNSEHYTWGGICDGWRLLKSPVLSVIQERVPPGSHHRLLNRGNIDLTFLVISAPPSHGDRVPAEQEYRVQVFHGCNSIL